MHLGQLGCRSLKQQPQPSFMVISAVAMLLSLLAAALEEEEEEEDAEMEELLWEGLFLEKLFCAVQDGFQTCGRGWKCGAPAPLPQISCSVSNRMRLFPPSSLFPFRSSQSHCCVSVCILTAWCLVCKQVQYLVARADLLFFTSTMPFKVPFQF